MDPATANTPAIEMSGVTVGSLHDPAVIVLEDVNWTVNVNEYWVVAGMQGSGKSDFMSMTAGLMPPKSGSYRFFGREMPIYEDELLAERLRLGLVFDSGQLFHNLTVRENIALPLRYHRTLGLKEVEQQVEAMLQVTDLLAWADKTPGSLGRTVQKRAGLARALILQPEVLLLDNPLGSLDFRQITWWLDFLGQLSAGHPLMAGRRVTLVATAEDLRPWRERASHFGILQNRRFKVLGTHRELAIHSDPLVKELLAEAPRGIN